MVRYVKKDHIKGNTIYANFKLKNIPYKPINIKEIMELDKKNTELNNVTIAIDEITLFADARRSSSKMNRMLSYFILQSRKRNCQIYATTQNWKMIDKRMREHTHILIEAKKLYNDAHMEKQDIRRYVLYDMRDPNHIATKRFVMDISKYYEDYDTNEVIQPIV